jgi:hypothetical protein
VIRQVFDLALVLDLCWRVGASREHESGVDLKWKLDSATRAMAAEAKRFNPALLSLSSKPCSSP